MSGNKHIAIFENQWNHPENPVYYPENPVYYPENPDSLY